MSKSDGKGAAANPTPVMRQFFAAKGAHPGALVFFRMGDFYELFYDDAVVASRALDLTLTSRNKGAEDEIPMAGVPHHAASAYIQRLLEQGFKVAICEQMADPSTVKGIVPREVVRVVTPGIVYDDAGLAARQNHYLASVEYDGRAWGIGALDMSTGELLECEAADAAGAVAELVRLDPREVLLGPEAAGIAVEVRAALGRATVREESESPIDDAEARSMLAGVAGVAGETEGEAHRGGGEKVSLVARRAAARCVAMARACEPGKALPVARLASYDIADTLLLDETTQRHLELVRSVDGDEKGALLAQIDETKTGFGARLLRRHLLAPLTRVADIRRRLDAVELFVTQPGLRADVRTRLTSVADLERLAVKLRVDRAAPRDLVALRRSLAELPGLAAALEACPDRSARDALAIPQAAPWIDECGDLHALLARAVAEDPPARASDGNVIRDGYDPALDESRLLQRDGQRMIVELEARLRETSGIGSLKLRYTRVFGWYMEVTRSHVDKAPREWRRKQTIATGERFTCEELDALADKMAHAEERSAAREAELYSGLVRELAKGDSRLHAVAARLAQWDVSSALAEVAHRSDFVRPVVDDSLSLVVEDGRHPVVERLAAAGRFVPNDVALDASDDGESLVGETWSRALRTGTDSDSEGRAARLWLVTGPNMAGKSTFMRQVALIVILAQMGSFVPARRAHVGVVDRVLTRVGASDNLAKGESTFMVEMKETANVLRAATRRSLVVLDEIGRGTSTYDGLAIAWAVAEHLHDVAHSRALFATHYHELTELAATHRGCENWSVSAREHQGDVVFLHKLQRGAASRSYGVACARLAGIPEPVLARAKAILGDLEKGAALPSGAHASLRGRTRAGKTQLDLFGGGAVEAPAPSEHAAVQTLRALDVDRLTPLEALQLIARLKQSLDAKQSPS
jgi:DNA mismatch repair protein MutS